MILSNVNIGTGPSAGDGDPLRTAFNIVNNNFQIITNNVNALTNSVNSVAGRTGNVILTTQDIIGINNYALSTAITTANLAMKGYVDSKITANIALLVNAAPTTLDTIRELADAIGDDPNFAVNIALSVSSANTKMRDYVDGQIIAANSAVTTANVGIIGYINQANTIQSAQVNAANLAIIAANLGMKGYVDSVASQSIYGNGNVKSYLTGGFDGNIIPSANVTYSLGNITHQWKDLFVSNNTIFIGGVPLSIDAGGNLLVNDTPVVGGVEGNITVGNSAVNFVANSSGDGYGSSTIQLIPDSNLGSDQYIIIDPTAPSHIHIRAGGTQDNSSAQLFLGGEGSYFMVASGSNPQLYIRSNNNDWLYDTNGNLTLPAGGQILDSTGNLYAAGSTYGNVQVATYLPTYTGNIQASNVFSDNFSATGSGNMLSLTTRNGDSNNSYASPQITMGYAGTDNYPSFIHTTHNAGTPIDNTIEFWTCDGSQFGTFPANVVLGLTVTNGNIKTGGILTDNYYYANGTPISFGSGSYSNVQVATYLPTYTGNVQAGNVKVTSAYRFATGAVTITNGDSHVELTPDTGTNALAGVKVGGNGYLLGPNNSRCITLNYGSVGGAVGLQSNVTIGTGGSGNLVVNGSLTIRGNIINGNVAGFSIGYRDVPQVSAGNVTLGLTDAGKHYYATASAPTTLTIPSNANVAFPVGTAITVVNAGVGTITVGKQAEASLYLAGNSTNSTRTLSSYGMATLLKTATDQWFINGTGLA